MSGWDGFLNDMDMAVQRDNYQKAFNRYEARVAELIDRADTGEDTAAMAYGVLHALQTQLERYAPTHLLIKDDSLIERIKKAALSAFRTQKPLDYGSAKYVGRTFRIPGHEGPIKSAALVPAAPTPGVVSPFARAATPAAPAATLPPTLEAVLKHPAHVELQQQYAGSLALRAALSEVVKQLDPNHPLIKDHFLQSNIRRAGLTAFTLANMDYNAARSAGVSFVLPKPAAKDADQPEN